MLKYLVYLFLCFPLLVEAQYPSSPANYVTDEAGILTEDQENLLNQKLSDFEKASSSQIFVYTASSLKGQDLEGLSQEIFHAWGIGGKDKDNGVLIAVFVNDHKFRIQTGYGLEGSLPDLLTKKIQDETMRPRFKERDFYAGIDQGIDKLIYYSAHAYAYEAKPDSFFSVKNLGSWALAFIPNSFLLILFSVLLFRKKPNKNRTPLVKGLLFGLALLLAFLPCIGAIFLFMMLFVVIDLKRSSRRYSSGGGYYSSDSDYSSSSSSSDYSSYDSGSSFDGGGGGDSGGGGSSSDW